MTTATSSQTRTSNPFSPAVKEQSYLRALLTGISGGGKTFSALRLAGFMLGGEDYGEDGGVKLDRLPSGQARIAFVDTERNSARKYSDDFPSNIAGQAMFDVLSIERDPKTDEVNPEDITNAILAAEQYGYEFIIVDSASHIWEGILDMKARLDNGGGSDKNQYTNWAKVNPTLKRALEAMLNYNGHVIACLRVKMEYAMEPDPNKGGKLTIKKLGMKEVMRDGIAYEFDVEFIMSLEDGVNTLTVGKSHCTRLKTGYSVQRPGGEIAVFLTDWLGSGVKVEIPLTKEQFIAGMLALGLKTTEEIGKFSKENNLDVLVGPRRYNYALDQATAILGAGQ